MFNKLVLFSVTMLFFFQNTFSGFVFCRRRKENVDGHQAIVWYSFEHNSLRSINRKVFKYKDGPLQGKCGGIDRGTLMTDVESKKSFDSLENEYQMAKHAGKHQAFLDWVTECGCAPNQGCKRAIKA